MFIDFAINSDKGRVRKNNEDRATVIINSLGYVIGIVCDGMGGHYGGKLASKIVVDYFKEEMLKMPSFCNTKESITSYINESITNVLIKVNDYASNYPELEDMGTTMVATITTPNETYVVNVGDSRVYFVNKVFIKKITEDHNVENLLKNTLKNGDIDSFDNWHSLQDKNALTSAIGPNKEFHIDIFTIKNKEGCFLLCTDGFYNFMKEDYIISLMLRPLTTIQKVGILMKEIVPISNDNVTLVMISLSKGDQD